MVARLAYASIIVRSAYRNQLAQKTYAPFGLIVFRSVFKKFYCNSAYEKKFIIKFFKIFDILFG